MVDTKQTPVERSAPGATVELTPELVRQVARRVYAMLRRDIQIEYERRQRLGQRDDHG